MKNTYGLSNNYSQVSVRYDESHEALWTFMRQKDIVPSYNYQIVKELTHHHEEIERSGGVLHSAGQLHHLRYSVAASLTPGVFNLGGQLTVIRELAMKREREALKAYGLQALNVLIQRLFRFNLSDLITISLIQGQALGAGLEAALSSDVIIAERNSHVGFPEIMFNLFPGMGAFSLVARKATPRIAEEMILGGKIYTAEEAYEMGLIDVLVDEGQGAAAVYNWIENNRKLSNGYLAIQKAKNRVNPVTKDELIDITMLWLEGAMKLNERDFKVMERFIRSQEKRYCVGKQELGENNVVALAQSA